MRVSESVEVQPQFLTFFIPIRIDWRPTTALTCGRVSFIVKTGVLGPYRDFIKSKIRGYTVAMTQSRVTINSNLLPYFELMLKYSVLFSSFE